MSETNAFQTLKQNLIGERIDRRLNRVENIVGDGWPDVNGCFQSVEFHLEMKSPKEPKRTTTPLFGSNHKYSQEQKNWFKAQLLAGGLAYGYIDTGKNRLLVSGKIIDDINEMTLNELILCALWHSRVPLKNKLHWEKLADVILARQI